MAKSGQARVLTGFQQNHLFDVINSHRYPEKNTAIMRISFKLALRAQEIALLRIKEVARLDPCPVSESSRGFILNEIMSLPAAFTKGADAMKRSKTQYVRKRVSFSVAEFDSIVSQVHALAIAGAKADASIFYPALKSHRGKSRDLPLSDFDLREALSDYLVVRLEKNPRAKMTDPLFLTQKGGAYSPNTLQEHMAMMLREWAGVEKASSHSGRRTVATDIIHRQKKSLKVAQKVLGHVSATTTITYDDPPEGEISDALANLN